MVLLPFFCLLRTMHGHDTRLRDTCGYPFLGRLSARYDSECEFRE